MAIDEDILMAQLGDIASKLDSIESDVGSIYSSMPDSPDTSMVERKLDEIISLLRQIKNNQ